MVSKPPRRRSRTDATWGENVVLADFGARRRQEMDRLRDAHGTHIRGEDSWASSQLMEAVSKATDSGRLARGREYFRGGKVLSVEFAENVVAGLVDGSQLEPFETSIHLRKLTDRQRDFVYDEMLSDSSHIRSILGGGAPGMDVASVLLHPGHVNRVSCTCPDKSAICKHVVALAYSAAERLEKDPSILLRWRGLNAQELLRPVQGWSNGGVGASPRKQPQARNAGTVREQQSEQVDSAEFWGTAAEPVDWEPLSWESGLEQGDQKALNEAMRSVAWHAVDQLKATHELEVCFETLEKSEPMFYYKTRLSDAVDKTTGEASGRATDHAAERANGEKDRDKSDEIGNNR